MNRQRRTEPIRLPGSPTEQARTVARGYRAALAQLDPEACARLDVAARATGQTWLFALTDAPAEGEVWTREQVAALFGVDPDTVSQWVRRGQLAAHPDPADGRRVVFLPADVDRLQEERARPRRRGPRTSLPCPSGVGSDRSATGGRRSTGI